MDLARALAEEKLLAFPPLLRAAGVAVDSQRTTDFLRAVKLVPLRGLADLARASRITLARSADELPVHDRVFSQWFGSAPDTLAGQLPPPAETPGNRPEADGRPPELSAGDTKGHLPSDSELRGFRKFGPTRDSDRRARILLRRALAALRPSISRRWRRSHRGDRIDLAATSRAARATFGETLRLISSSRRPEPRRLLLLIDISGSMKANSEIALRFAHGLAQSRRRVETFCFGNRLTRLTRSLRHRDADLALSRLASLVFDLDGGTRIGPSLSAFLRQSRFAAATRGADVLLISDGLETGDPAAMVANLARLSRLAHRLVLATPLAADRAYQPRTRGLKAALPFIDAITGAATPTALIDTLASLARLADRPRGRAIRFDTQSGAAR